MKYLPISSRIRYAILHGWQSFPEAPTSDLDIVVAPDDLGALERQIGEYDGGRVVQLLQHEASCFYFVLMTRGCDNIHFIPVDVALDYRRDGRVFLTADELLADRRQWNGLWIASPGAEFSYLLVKKVLKGSMVEYHKKRLKELVRELDEQATIIAIRLFGKRLGDLVISSVGSSDWAALEAEFTPLKKALLRDAVNRDPFNKLRYWVPELRRIWRRCRYPTGLSVAVLGPDGAGKSTLIQILRERLLRAFRGTRVFHLRPYVIGRKRSASVVTDPHGKPVHPKWLSLIKILYLIWDYNLGYLLRVWPKLVRSRLIFFDRYYPDLLVDPCRYRYGGPKWIARLARRFVPEPDLFLILDVPEDQIMARKCEVSLQELSRLRKEYLKLASDLPNAILVDSSQPPDKVARAAGEAILEYLHQRYLKRRQLWFQNKSSGTLA